MPKARLKDGIALVDLLVEHQLQPSRSAARRQAGVAVRDVDELLARDCDGWQRYMRIQIVD
ncbi:MAG: hypothetical protein VCA57_20455 [Pseudomonas sp.]|uniref:hypothetical protein n=1 Tax=Pseudomonas sp. TaxID=306 RepID=UPI0039822915